ncbi:AraC family transcriptional regulator [Antarcticibacterium sp. 1MA-6-2]|uniref:AraC family transcriptional regulator n=1 Tax=Antarcticibacterium sp. 1MA-6-2 TaxID=2908210 RepID=UPI001F227786|nr:AraC family transcriptional regulator [Antarcticibacterium sp. 1MA-6-2]UJH92671.1 AraC family transcriptional regulator [Antarcticibacterium sp. 1MA-6-2]
MKANFRKLNIPIERAFHLRRDVREYFDDAWHYHEMLELVYIEKGKGERYVGDSINSFSSGEVVLVGKKLPHLWRSPKSKTVDTKKCSCIILQFSENLLEGNFFNLLEFQDVRSLLKRAERGIVFQEKTRAKLSKKLQKLIKSDGMVKIILFLEILQIASESKQYKLLSSSLFNENIYNKDQTINKVFSYVMENFAEEITLKDVADLTDMNRTAFCRYFKRRTKITFTALLNDIRIANACKLIRENNSQITEAGYSSGYNSPSYFYKQFKLIKGMSPSEYKSKNLVDTL